MVFIRTIASALMRMNNLTVDRKSEVSKSFASIADQCGIRNLGTFFDNLDNFREADKSLLVGAVGLAGLRSAIPHLKKLVESEDSAASASVMALASLLNEDEINTLVRHIYEHKSPVVRAAYIHCAMFCHMGPELKEHVFRQFHSLANCVNESPLVRSEAIDGVSFLAVGIDRRRRSCRQAFRDIGYWLSDSNADVRASAIYAVTLHRILKWRELVTSLKNDKSLVFNSRILTVGEIASECVRRLDQDA